MTLDEFKKQFPRILLRDGDHVTEKWLEETLQFAQRMGLLDKFLQHIEYLNGYARDRNRSGGCRLYKDSAPYSFYFVLLSKEGNPWFNGGLIYHGPHESGVSGPQFSVRLGDTSEADWSIHT